jgi:hypothetical protein
MGDFVPINPNEWIVAALEARKFIIAWGDGFGDYVLSPSEWRQLRKEILDRDDHICQYCGGKADSVDHVFPKIQGGLTVEANLVAACKPCNSRKGGRL